MPSKQCFKCERQLKLSEFYRHPAMGDGHLGKCKDCAKRDSVAHYREKWDDPLWRATERERGREKYHRLYSNGRSAPIDPVRRAANTAVGNAVHAGRMVKPSECQDCGQSGRIEGHHADYSKPLEVDWLCTQCHGLRHRRAA